MTAGLPKIVLVLSASVLLSGCASVSVTSYSERRDLAPPGLGKDTPVAVKPFGGLRPPVDSSSTLLLDAKTGEIRVSGSPASPPTSTGLAVAKGMSDFLRSGQRDQVRIAETKPSSGLWITGQITKEERGSRTLRTIVGLGFGRTKMECRTFVYNVDKSATLPWLEIHTSGGSNREPGALFSAMPSPVMAFNLVAAASSVATMAMQGGKGLTQDARRTGKTLGLFVVEKASSFDGKKPHVRAKRRGQLETPLGSFPAGWSSKPGRVSAETDYIRLQTPAKR